MDPDKISKYLNESASSKEQKEVEDWIGSSQENQKRFNFLKAQYIASTFNETIETTNVDEGFRRYKDNIDRNSRSNQRTILLTSLKYAAMIAVVFGLTYLYNRGDFNTDTSPIVPIDAVTLKLENGNIQVINEEGTTQVVDSRGNTVGVQQGKRLQYQTGAAEKLTYNTLTVPNGKLFDVVLSDSTHILLNAGTSLKYPIKFIKGRNREVYLSGEAFFEVTKDAAHPFIVHANGLNVRVLGTKFNVSSYEDENNASTVLVEGSVEVYQPSETYKKEQDITIFPGQQASLHDGVFTVRKVNIEKYIAWTQGKLYFVNDRFSTIIKELERYYNVKIENNNPRLNDVRYTGTFESETLEHILETFKRNTQFKYIVKSDKIIIESDI